MRARRRRTGWGSGDRAIALTIQGLAHGRREGWDDAGTTAGCGWRWPLTMAFVGGGAASALALDARGCSGGRDLRLRLTIFASGAAIYASTFLAPMFVQAVQHYSPTRRARR
jgi:hypothetical protein